MTRLTRAISPAALLVSVLALVVAASAGSAYAATKIGTSQLKDNAVTSKKIKNRTVAVGDLATATVRSLRGATGPQGPAGPQGPGSTTFDRSVAINATSQNVTLPFGTLNLLCNASQVRVQVNVTSTALNPVMVAGTHAVDGGAPKSDNAVAGGEYAMNETGAAMWLDWQVSDIVSGRTGTLRVQGYRQGGTCRWIGQYVP